MLPKYDGKNRRQFIRHDYDKHVGYSVIKLDKERSEASDFLSAVSKNLSVSGVLFKVKSENIPIISDILAMELDYKMQKICNEIEKSALIIKGRIIGRVVRIEDYEDGTCGVGVAFVAKTDPILNDLKKIEDLIEI